MMRWAIGGLAIAALCGIGANHYKTGVPTCDSIKKATYASCVEQRQSRRYDEGSVRDGYLDTVGDSNICRNIADDTYNSCNGG